MSTQPLQIGDMVTPTHTFDAIRLDAVTGTPCGHTQVTNGVKYEVTALSGPFADLQPCRPDFHAVRCETADLARW